jgi:hypothetical protein
MQIPFTATDEVRAAIARIGRTEDVQFAPDRRRLALVGHIRNRLLILDVKLEPHAQGVALTSFLEIESDALDLPHGVAWIDPHTFAIANRGRNVALFELPRKRPATGSVKLEPLQTIGPDRIDFVATPGSVSVASVGMNLVELLVCNNYVHHVSRHLLDRNDGYAVIASEVIIQRGLEVPDGVAHSSSGRWLAISNHDAHTVNLYRNDAELNPASRPNGVLHGVKYPHGLRFAADDKALLVADAGAPLVHLYRSESGDWTGDREPVSSLQVVSDAAFKRGHYNPQEGGPKGIDLASDDGLMVSSCREAPLAFFDMRSLIPPAPRPDRRENSSEAERARETLVRYLASDRSRLRDATDAIRRISEHEVRMVVNNRAWKLTAPLRWVAARQRAARIRWRGAD